MLATTTEVMGDEDPGELGRKDNRDKDVNKTKAGERILKTKVDSAMVKGMTTGSMVVVTAKIECKGEQDGRENQGSCGKNKRCFIQ